MATVRAHLPLTRMDYVQLAVALRRFGHEEDNNDFSVWIDRGRFSARLMVQCLIAMGFDTLELPSIDIIDAVEVADRAPSAD